MESCSKLLGHTTGRLDDGDDDVVKGPVRTPELRPKMFALPWDLVQLRALQPCLLLALMRAGGTQLLSNLGLMWLLSSLRDCF